MGDRGLGRDRGRARRVRKLRRRPENDDLTLPGTGSQAATDLLEKRLPDQANGSVPIVLQSDTSLAQGQNKQAVDETVKSVEQNEYVRQVLSPFDPQGANDITKDGKIAYLAVALKVSSGDLDDDEANSVLDSAQPARDAGIAVSAGGSLGQQLSSPSTRASEIIGVVAALIVLLFAFRTFVAAPLPVTTAVVALLTGLAIVGLAGHAISIPSIAPTLGIMLGLAVGTDYSLFIISRHLRLLGEGAAPEDSIARSVAIDAFVVLLIMPGLLELIGERNWYLPRWLDRSMPDLKVEGDPALRAETPSE